MSYGKIALTTVAVTQDLPSILSPSLPLRGIVSHVSQKIGILRLVKRIFVDTNVLLRCFFAFCFTNH